MKHAVALLIGLASCAIACDVDLGLSNLEFTCKHAGACDDSGVASAALDAGSIAPPPIAIAPDAGSPDASEAPDATVAVPDATTPQVGTCAADSPATWRKLEVANARARSQHSAVLVGDDMVVFGGASSGNDVASLRLVGSSTAFQVITPDDHGPDARSAQAAVYDPIDPELLVVGGRSTTGVELGGAWCLALNPSNAIDWSQALSAPPAFSEQAAVAIPSHRNMYIFGGCAAGTPTNEMYTLSLGLVNLTTSVTLITPPPARCGHTMSYDEQRDRIIMFGGQGAGGTMRDVWVFSPATSAWTPLQTSGDAPPDRSDHVAVIDTVRDRLIVFGGRRISPSGTSVLDDIWALSLADPNPCWAHLSPTGTSDPGARYGHTAVFHTDRVIVYGGQNDAVMDDVWELSF
jgi:hypothetical protein